MSKTSNWLALDIGGANLKIADGLGFATIESFPLWQRPSALADALRSMISTAPTADQFAITMTGELADCFETKREGVAAILKAVEQAAGEVRARVYGTDGQLMSHVAALCQPDKVSASNWHALAQFAGRFAAHGTALLIDIGSTTTDLIGLADGKPVNVGATDTERLSSGELVYTGVVRTPVATVAGHLPYRGTNCGAAREVYATMLDVFLMLDELSEEPDNCDTADGRAATKRAARDRLARMICADRNSFDESDAKLLAESTARNQRNTILVAARRVADRLPAKPAAIVVSGKGEFVARRIADELSPDATVIALSEELGDCVSICAPAHALAVLAREMVS